ncbi:hypothetical protein BGZ82_011437 [Podila clonocystis]|nr:hypothetical protein BGZ82_011437 [Podila clonocystis]
MSWRVEDINTGAIDNNIVSTMPHKRRKGNWRVVRSKVRDDAVDWPYGTCSKTIPTIQSDTSNPKTLSATQSNTSDSKTIQAAPSRTANPEPAAHLRTGTTTAILAFCFATELEWSGFNSWKPLSVALLNAKPPSTTRAVHHTGVALPPSPLRVPLRSLDLIGCSGGYILSEFPALAAFTDLTSLSMKDCNTEYSALLSIFQACPRLTRLCFDGNGLIPCDADKVVDKSGVESSAAPLDPLSVPQLKALSMARPNLTTCQLLELLETQSSLKILELHDLSMSIKPQDPAHLPRLRRLTKGILAYLRQRGSSIQNLYVPYSHDVGSIDATLNWVGETFEEALAQTCPTVCVWRVMADASGYFPVCRGLARYHNVVTTLDLDCVRGSPLWLRYSSDLDNFLCHPHARALLHLRLPTMHGRPESMNAFRDVDNDLSWLVEGTSALKPATQRQPVWACQGLKTLTIGFSGEEKEDINRSGKYHSIHQARLIFDYVSRVCPNLEELVMTMNLIHLFLETGFIFLIRLRRLRKLEVKLDWWTEKRNVRADIDWMSADLAGTLVQDVRMEERCQNRHWNNQCQSMEVLHEIERRIVAGRVWSQGEQGPRSVGGGGGDDLQMDEEDDDRWIYLGLLADIPRVLLKLRREGQAGRHCWPKMETLRIVDNLLQDSTQAEEEIKKRRPEIRCHDFKVPAPWTWKEFCP